MMNKATGVEDISKRMNKATDNCLDLWQQSRIIGTYSKIFPYYYDDDWKNKSKNYRFCYFNTISPVLILRWLF